MLHLKPCNAVPGGIHLRRFKLGFRFCPGELCRGTAHHQHQHEAYERIEKFHEFIFLLEVTEPRVRDQATIFNPQRSHLSSLMGILYNYELDF